MDNIGHNYAMMRLRSGFVLQVPCRQFSYIGTFQKRAQRCRATETKTSQAKEAVNAGLFALERKSDPEGAIELFESALTFQPTDQEASAAVYNIACCYVKMKQWQKAADQIVKAVNDYRLDIEIPKKDIDLKELRARPEWEDALGKMRGGITTRLRYDLISELRSPFRLFRFWIFGGLSIGAGAGLVFILASLVKAIQSGGSIEEPLKNLAINTVALLVLSVLFYRDYQDREKLKLKIEREELLSQLQVERTTGDFVSLLELRGIYRPVILCGSKAYCRRSIDAARPYFSALKERGIAVISVVLTEMDPSLKNLKEDFQSTTTTGFGETSSEELKKVNRWELKPAQIDEWKEWLNEQKQFSGLDAKDFYFQVQLDGSVRSSGPGMPSWNSIVSDVPPLDDIRTKLTDNIGF